MSQAISELHRVFDAWLQIAKENGFYLPDPVQANAPSPLVVIDRSHLGAAESIVTDLGSILPPEFNDDNHGATTCVVTGNIDMPDPS